ncbi:MAG: pyruvate kinase [Halanaerobiaceae bacterium]|nr:pyruvate kinase [Halanaerobiaceae bacterium]
MRKTKIVATIGPASDNKETVTRLVEAGLDVARLNLSHGDYEEHSRKIEIIREVEDDTGKTIGIMLDTRGPEVRTGPLEEDKEIFLYTGDEIVLTIDDVTGTKECISVSYKELTKDVKEGSKILIDDGLLELQVLAVKGNDIRCKVLNGGLLGSYKGVNIPGVSLNLPALTKRDKEFIHFGMKMGINFIAASFVRKAQDIIAIRAFLDNEGAEGIYIIAKIENQEGVDNIDEILEVADGIMIARGDLGVEIPPEKVPVIQKKLIRKCNEAGKPVITATQMLNSMIGNPRPTRAEASDVANAILDGTDAIMLSGESAIGKYPIEAVKTMDRIAREIEGSAFYQETMFNTTQKNRAKVSTITESISSATCKIAMEIGARCIISATTSGSTARMVSKFRPNIPIIAVTHDKYVKHYLTVCWGIHPLQLAVRGRTTDELISNSIKAVRRYGLVKAGDRVVITAGTHTSGTTNLIEVIDV